MLNGFKAFILRGNVVDLAVGVVIGAAFGTVVTTLTEGLLTPLIAIPGEANFSELKFTLNQSEFLYGQVLNALVSFLLIAAAVYFFVVVPVNKLVDRRKTEPPVEATTRECPECLSSIPLGARRCAFCTAPVLVAATVAATVTGGAGASGLEGTEAEALGGEDPEGEAGGAAGLGGGLGAGPAAPAAEPEDQAEDGQGQQAEGGRAGEAVDGVAGDGAEEVAQGDVKLDEDAAPEDQGG